MTTLRARLDELRPIDFQPSIVGLDVTEIPPEQSAVWLMEFRETEAPHCLARKATCYSAMDDTSDFAARSRTEWVDTVPMGDEVAA